MTLIILLSVIGIAALLAELVLPGGILGMIGALCLVGAVIATFVEFGSGAGAAATVILFLIGLATLGWWMKFFHMLPITKRLILESESGEDHDRDERERLVGKSGVTLTDLTPSGHARIDGRKLSVMTQAASIPKGTEIEIIALRGPSILVRPLDRES